jgi:hypothetical protein
VRPMTRYAEVRWSGDWSHDCQIMGQIML